MDQDIPTAAGTLVLREDALERMAKAIGPSAYYKTGKKAGKPIQTVLTGTNRTASASTLYRGKHEPHLKTVVLVASRYAEAAGIDFWAALPEMFRRVDESARSAA